MILLDISFHNACSFLRERSCMKVLDELKKKNEVTCERPEMEQI